MPSLCCCCSVGKSCLILCDPMDCSTAISPVLHYLPAAASTKSLQSCLTLCNLIDGSLSGSSVPGILQARTLEWVAISFSKYLPEFAQFHAFFILPNNLWLQEWDVSEAGNRMKLCASEMCSFKHGFIQSTCNNSSSSSIYPIAVHVDLCHQTWVSLIKYIFFCNS